MRISKCPICNGDLAWEGVEVKKMSEFYLADVEYYHCSYCKAVVSNMLIGHVNCDNVVTHCREELHFSRCVDDEHCYHRDLQRIVDTINLTGVDCYA